MIDSPVRLAAVRRVGPLDVPSATDSDLVAVEEPLQLEIVHGATREPLNVGIVLRTPGRDEDLAAGLLFAEGFIRTGAAVERFEFVSTSHLRIWLQPDIRVEERLARRVLVRSSACGLCGRDAIDDLASLGARSVEGGPPVPSALIRSLPGRLREHQPVFNETGGLHAAAFIDAAGTLTSIAEDVGRHNAVDKLVGAALRDAGTGLLRTPVESGTGTGLLRTPVPILLVSGRAAFEIVHKAVMAGVSVLAAVGAPSSLAVETARAFNLTLIGFLRDDRFNIYSGFERIV